MTTISDVVTNRLSTNKACGFGRLAISADLKPLPVEISLFFAFEDKVVNRLEWNTVSEINNDYFIVEWSLNGEDWFFLAKNDGAGTTTREQHYSATHRHPSSKTFTG